MKKSFIALALIGAAMLPLAASATKLPVCTASGEGAYNCTGVTANYGLTLGTDVLVGYRNKDGAANRGIVLVRFNPPTIFSIGGGLVYNKIYRCFSYPGTGSGKYYLTPQQQDITAGGFEVRAIGTVDHPYLQFRVDTTAAVGNPIDIQCTDITVE